MSAGDHTRERDTKIRAVGRCETCGTIHAGEVWPDGTFQALGRKPCACGEKAYAVMDPADLGLPTEFP